MSEAIFVEGLTKAYHGKTVVDHLNLSVKRGTVFGLLGANGAGKSTTIECMLGTKQADAGTVRLLGQDPSRRRRTLFQRVGVQFQEGDYHKEIKVSELCEETACLYRRCADWRKLCEQFGIGDKANTPVSPVFVLGVELSMYIVYCAVSLLTLSAAALLWGVRLHGSLLAFLGSWLLTMLSTLSIGMLAGGAAKNTKQASVIASSLYFPHADLFRHNAADRGHAKGHAEDCQLFPADTGTYDDEEYILRYQRGKLPAADLCYGWSCRTLHSSCHPVFPLGIREEAAQTVWLCGTSPLDVFP